MKKTLKILLALSLMLLGGSSWAAFIDGKKCKDHPLFSRLADYEIHNCAIVDFDVWEFPKPERKEWSAPEDFLHLEGKIHAVSYRLKSGATPLSGVQVVRNFQNAVQKDGGKVLGDYSSAIFANLPKSAGKYLSESPGGISFEACTAMLLNKGGSDFRIFVCASEAYQDYMVVTVEQQAMKQEVSVKELEKKMDKDGFLTFYINFDTNKALIKPESAAAVEQIAALLKGAPALQVSIEGHTDNIGTPEKNKTLSEARARAVMDAVAGKGVAANRMNAVGRGQEAPIADNRQEEGRALNRRVEVVKKK